MQTSAQNSSVLLGLDERSRIAEQTAPSPVRTQPWGCFCKARPTKETSKIRLSFALAQLLFWSKMGENTSILLPNSRLEKHVYEGSQHLPILIYNPKTPSTR